MSDASLSPQQLQVVNAWSEGMNSTDAAALAGVHRNTLANWRRNSLFFREALADAQYDRALLFRERMEDRLDRAFETLDSILADPKASPSVRLKAALFILEKATTPPLPKNRVPLEIEEVHVSPQPTVHPVNNPAQNAQCAQSAQKTPTPFRRETPKVGRNEACPCGSGQKYKRCCLNKPHSDAQAAAA